MRTLYESILDIDDNIDKLTKNLLDINDILKSKTKQQFNNYCEVLGNNLIDKIPEIDDIIVNIRYTSHINKEKYYNITLGRYGGRIKYRIYFAYGSVHIDKESGRMHKERLFHDDMFGVLPKDIAKKIKFV